jgi:hypothetical protein
MDRTQKVFFLPSYSPENWPDNADGAPAVINANMDIIVCREVLTHLIQASEILGVEPENVPKWKEMLAKMPPHLLDTDGALKVWAWPTLEERLDHCHVSHLYGVWPGDEIDPDRTLQFGNLYSDENKIPEAIAEYEEAIWIAGLACAQSLQN